jgi:hypothetical protein
MAAARRPFSVKPGTMFSSSLSAQAGRIRTQKALFALTFARSMA